MNRLSLFTNNVFTSFAKDKYNQMFPSPEQKQLQKAITEHPDTYSNMIEFNYYANNVQQCYTTIGADEIRSHPTSSRKSNLDMLSIIEAKMAAEKALTDKNDEQFMDEFDKILALTPTDTSGFNDKVALAAAAKICGLYEARGPARVIQMQAMEKLSRHAFNKSQNAAPLGGGHDQASSLYLGLCIDTGISAAKAYDTVSTQDAYSLGATIPDDLRDSLGQQTLAARRNVLCLTTANIINHCTGGYYRSKDADALTKICPEATILPEDERNCFIRRLGPNSNVTPYEDFVREERVWTKFKLKHPQV